MAAITLAELHALGLRGAATTNIDEADLLAQCESATATARSYTRTRYPDPAAITDPSYKEDVACLAAYRILSTRGFDPINKGSDANVLHRHDAAMRHLRDVNKGLASLDVAEVLGDGYVAALDDGDPFGGVLSDPRRE